jgi:FkbM family methyltransferase
MLDEIRKKLSLSKRVHATSLRDEVRLVYLLGKYGLEKRNFKMNMIIQVDNVKYKLVDLESLLIVSPRFEEYMPNYLSPAENDVFIDVGTHVGKYTLCFAKKVGPRGKVVGIEPDPTNFEALLEGIRANALDNIVALNIAAFDKECRLPLYVAPSEGKSGRFLVGKGGSSIKRKEGRTAYEVTAKPLDQIVTELGLNHVDWIKIDAEGVEFEVLKGCKKILEIFKPKIIVECTEHLTEVQQLIKESKYNSKLIAPDYYYFEPIQ